VVKFSSIILPHSAGLIKKGGVKMSEEILRALMPILIAMFFVWLLYRIKVRVTKIIKNKVVDEFPVLKNALENFERKIDFVNSRIDSLERKVNELENKSTKGV